MKATYDTGTDTLSIIFKQDVEVAESDEDKPGIVLDYDEHGSLVSLEILGATDLGATTRAVRRLGVNSGE